MPFTDSSLHRLVLRLALRPDNIDSWAELLNPQNLSCFFPDSAFLHLIPGTIFSRQFSLSLTSSIPLVFTLLTIILYRSPSLPALGGSGIRGIPEGDFPAF